MTDPLAGPRRRIDAIDQALLELLKERNGLLDEVLATKQREGLPVFVPQREAAKIDVFRKAAIAADLDPDWAEDFLRMIMGSSRARQAGGVFPTAPGGERRVLLVGGGGRMGRLYSGFLERSGHEVRVLEEGDWDRAAELCAGCQAVIVTVPIRVTEEVIARLGPHLDQDTLLVDFTSHKSGPVRAMLTAHAGPVAGLHPMHGPDVKDLSKQLMIFCPGRDPEAAVWLTDQVGLWGMRVTEMAPEKHDQGMHLVQGLRHFLALLQGSFLARRGMRPERILDLSSPIYRAELMMVGRIFAQDPELYADIVFGDAERRAMLLDFLEHHGRLAELVRADDKAGFVAEFDRVGEFFGDFAEQAMVESGYLIHRLADRYV